jgi:hypothetical protein
MYVFIPVICAGHHLRLVNYMKRLSDLTNQVLNRMFAGEIQD